MNGNMQ